MKPHAGNPITVPLKGSGDATTLIVVPSTPVDFGEVPVGYSSDPQPVGLKNVSVSSLALSEIDTSNPDFILDISNTMLTLAPNNGETIFQVRFMPSGVGPESATVSIHGGDNGDVLGTANFVGTGFEQHPLDLSTHVITLDAGVRTLGGGAGGSCSVSRRPHSPLGCAVLLLLFAFAQRRRR